METKDIKLKAYVIDKVMQKPFERLIRHFIHSKSSCGYWAAVRDASQSERLANDVKSNQVVKHFTMGYNPKILNLWEELVLLDGVGNCYRIKTKPDEFRYQKDDIKITAHLYQEVSVFLESEDIYD